MSEIQHYTTSTISLVIPTLNAEEYLLTLLQAISEQKPRPPDEIIIIDSESSDKTREIVQNFPNTTFELITNFSHGRARNKGIKLAKSEYIVFLSQDAIPKDEHWLHNLVKPFENPKVAATFSRQVPKPDANPMERLFLATHFPEKEHTYTPRTDNKDLVFQRDLFFSNVSSAMRRSVGLKNPFDETIIMSEDQQFARDVLLSGHSVTYTPSSIVNHSHNYTLSTLFKRYFDSAYSLSQVFPKHGIGQSIKIGLAYLGCELKHIITKKPLWLPYYLFYALSRSLAVALGHRAEKLPTRLAQRLSFHPFYWQDKHAPTTQSKIPMPLYIQTMLKQRLLISQLIKREISKRYKGSLLGGLWAFLTPLFQLGLYTLVFGVIFRSSWENSGDSGLQSYSLILFCGLSVFSIFSEVLNQAPRLILNHANYVKKVVFPLEVLPVVNVTSAFFQGLISLFLCVLMKAILTGTVSLTVLALPFLLIPYFLLVLSICWLASSLSVYFRDIQQITPPLLTAAFFLSPIIYNISMVPEWLLPIYRLNPLCFFVDGFRRILLWDQLPEIGAWTRWTIASFILAHISHYIFMRLRKGFADVV